MTVIIWNIEKVDGFPLEITFRSWVKKQQTLLTNAGCT